MALIKNISLVNGESGNYWKIISISIDKKSMSVFYRVSLYKDGSFSSGDPIKYGMFSFKVSVSKQDLASDLIAFGYSKIKSGDIVSQYDLSDAQNG